MMRSRAFKALLALAGVFGAGAVTGGVAGIIWERQQLRVVTEHDVAERRLERLEASLELTAQQVECMRPVMSEFAERIRIARRNALADVSAVWCEINAQLERELKPHQLKKFREIQARDLAHWELEQNRRCGEPSAPAAVGDEILRLEP